MRRQSSPKAKSQRTLGIDIGGTGLKASVLNSVGAMVSAPQRVATPYPCTPPVLIRALLALVKPLPAYDRVSVGFPGVVRDGAVITAPHFGTPVWRGFSLANALGKKLKKPVRLINDADMQGLAAIKGRGLELVITLGTGIGTALFRNGELMPHLEMAHHPLHKKKTYNEYAGDRERHRIGKKKWNTRVQKMIRILAALTNYDRLYIGGGNARRITFKLEPNTRIVSNKAGILGGIALWRRDFIL